jgi:hypothetical protein
MENAAGGPLVGWKALHEVIDQTAWDLASARVDERYVLNLLRRVCMTHTDPPLPERATVEKPVPVDVRLERDGREPVFVLPDYFVTALSQEADQEARERDLAGTLFGDAYPVIVDRYERLTGKDWPSYSSENKAAVALDWEYAFQDKLWRVVRARLGEYAGRYFVPVRAELGGLGFQNKSVQVDCAFVENLPPGTKGVALAEVDWRGLVRWAEGCLDDMESLRSLWKETRVKKLRSNGPLSVEDRAGNWCTVEVTCWGADARNLPQFCRRLFCFRWSEVLAALGEDHRTSAAFDWRVNIIGEDGEPYDLPSACFDTRREAVKAIVALGYFTERFGLPWSQDDLKARRRAYRTLIALARAGEMGIEYLVELHQELDQRWRQHLPLLEVEGAGEKEPDLQSAVSA